MSLPENRNPTHPSDVLLEVFLIPMGISQVALAKHLGISAQKINAIVRGKCAVTPTIAWLLSQAFGTTPEFWMNLQMAYDLARNKPKHEIESLVAVA